MEGVGSDIRFLEHPHLGVVAIRGNLQPAEVTTFLKWIERVLTPVVEESAIDNLPVTLSRNTPISKAVVAACARRDLPANGGSGYGGGGYGGGGYGGSGGRGAKRCYRCGEMGHTGRICPQNGGPGGGGRRSEGGGPYGQSSYATGANATGIGSGYSSSSGGGYGGGSGGGGQGGGVYGSVRGGQDSESGTVVRNGYGSEPPRGYGSLPERIEESSSSPPVYTAPPMSDGPAATGGSRQTDTPPQDEAEPGEEGWVPKLDLIKGEEKAMYDLISDEE
ncbi:zinc knuckle protein [Gregarina niphandrodes]|uniref:Zinc knuckle protein n=1 Tax=Gregarina niphandrodes TaxID=110365 RepID=A0A023B2D8_GRENI|nr:zinc knuckle protein [Gregarina niphandrodes]EZG53503.1 zinc knuckle protein [Gregarina niphandrodes]|eukprot:XP_011131870.1 zinc knuckle protein [Gregarina niphandrodes]